MKILDSSFVRMSAFALALPMLGLSAVVQINSTCIDAPSCTNPAPLTYAIGASQTGTANSSFSVGSDAYSFSSSFALGVSSSGGTYFDVYPTITYVGNSPAATSDSITVNFYGSIYDAAASNYDGAYTEYIPLNVGSNSTASGELFVDSQGVGLVGPFGPGTYTESVTKTLTGVDGSTLNEDYQFIFDFAAGAVTGTSDSSPTPEPAQIVPTALGLLGFALTAWLRRKRLA